MINLHEIVVNQIDWAKNIDSKILPTEIEFGSRKYQTVRHSSFHTIDGKRLLYDCSSIRLLSIAGRLGFVTILGVSQFNYENGTNDLQVMMDGVAGNKLATVIFKLSRNGKATNPTYFESMGGDLGKKYRDAGCPDEGEIIGFSLDVESTARNLIVAAACRDFNPNIFDLLVKTT